MREEVGCAGGFGGDHVRGVGGEGVVDCDCVDSGGPRTGGGG